ncbi:hypothetical protein MTP99_013566 [Tenebrio molitor]|nr:hypothetical protein MTP99_013566 [Tenebrio molitor]
MSSTNDQLFLDIFEYEDPRTQNYFLMSSPLPLFFILATYVSFIFKIGPAVMKNRQPVNLDKVMMVYNWAQIILNATIFIMGLGQIPRMSLFCSPLDQSNDPHVVTMVNLHYYYMMLKILDLLDTVFFVLRKKNNQVTFLHVYHHLMMAIFTWITVKFFAGGQVYFLGMPNLFVHVVMYFYYFLTAWDPIYKESIWWKKYITQLQLVQHCFIFLSFIIPFLNANCSYPKALLGIYLTQTTLMIYLFTDFYIKTYVKKRSKLH